MKELAVLSRPISGLNMKVKRMYCTGWIRFERNRKMGRGYRNKCLQDRNPSYSAMVCYYDTAPITSHTNAISRQQLITICSFLSLEGERMLNWHRIASMVQESIASTTKFQDAFPWQKILVLHLHPTVEIVYNEHEDQAEFARCNRFSL